MTLCRADSDAQVEERGRRGIHCVAVCLARGDGPGRVLGLLMFLDLRARIHGSYLRPFLLCTDSCPYLQVEEYGRRGIRCMAVGLAEGNKPWRVLGLLTFLDPPRPDTRDTLEKALGYGVDTKMVRPSLYAGLHRACGLQRVVS